MSAALEDALYQRSLATATPATLPLVKRSAYLADALRSMQTQGAAASGTPFALGANLLADALLKYGSDKSDRKLAAAQAGDQASLQKAYVGNLLDQPPNAPVSPPGGSQIGPAPPPPPSAPITSAPLPPVADARPGSLGGLVDALSNGVPPPQPGNTGLAQALDPDVVRTVWGEARGEGAAGQRAVAAVIHNRAQQAGMTPNDVVHAPHQFAGLNPQSAGLDPSSPQYQQIAANIGPVMDGSMPDPTGGADHFFNPQLAHPGWGQGPGQMVGQQKFMHLGYGGQPSAQPPQVPQGPPQVATNGPLPVGAFPPAPPPQAGPAGAPQPGPGVMQPPPPNPVQGAPLIGGPGGQAPSAGMSPPAGGAAIPTGPGPTPQETAMMRQYLADPRTMQMGMEMAAKIRQRMASPLEAPKNMVWSQQAGQYVPMPGVGSTHVAGPAGSSLETDPFGHQQYVTPPETFRSGPGPTPGSQVNISSTGKVGYEAIPGMQGAAPAGTRYDPSTGTFVPIAQPQMITSGAQGPGGGNSGSRSGLVPLGSLIQRDPTTGEVKADPRLGPANDIVKEALTAPEVTEYAKLSHAFGGITGALSGAMKNNGALDTSFVDATGQVINPGRAMTVGSTKLWLQHYGLPEEIAGHVANIFGNGYITPKTMNDGLSVMKAYADNSHAAAVSKLGKASDALAGFGVSDPRLAVDSVPGIPQVSWLNGNSPAAGGSPAGGGNSAPHLSPQQAQALPPGTRFIGQDGVARVRH